MDALMLRFLQGYVRGTFGVPVWQTICRRADVPVETFEPMLRYAPGLADQVAAQAAAVLGRPVETIWEDLGTYLVTSPGHEGVRRLLRFGGIGCARATLRSALADDEAVVGSASSVRCTAIGRLAMRAPEPLTVEVLTGS